MQMINILSGGCRAVLRKSLRFFAAPLTGNQKNKKARPPQKDAKPKPVKRQSRRKLLFGSGKSLKDFLPLPASDATPIQEQGLLAHYRDELPSLENDPTAVFIETYGCQMNVNDTEIIRAILLDHLKPKTDDNGNGNHTAFPSNQSFTLAEDAADADVVLLNTCAVRENAERKIWSRLHELGAMRPAPGKRPKRAHRRRPVVGLLGCMAERLQSELLEKSVVDVVVGPDSYRDLPRLLGLVMGRVDVVAGEDPLGDSASASGSLRAMNVQLSQDETYGDIIPVRRVSSSQSSPSPTAFVSIMRGCNNMCSFCVVPFTRGRERSRSTLSILEEIRQLSREGVKEVCLLGQNVNSFWDRTATNSQHAEYEVAPGFSNLYNLRSGDGVRFAELLLAVSEIDPEMRVRFTSPHPKDFPEAVLQAIAATPNICNQLHMPAQSGSSTVLDRMRRGYTHEAYLDLVARAREMIPGVALSSDFIVGFCGETEDDHLRTLELVRAAKFNQAFMFAYSEREKTTAHRRYADDVPQQVKKRRLQELIDVFHETALSSNKEEIGSQHLVLVEGLSKKSKRLVEARGGVDRAEDMAFTGRTDTNKRVVFPAASLAPQHPGGETRFPVAGDYVCVRVKEAGVKTLFTESLYRTTLQDYYKASLS